MPCYLVRAARGIAVLEIPGVRCNGSEYAVGDVEGYLDTERPYNVIYYLSDCGGLWFYSGEIISFLFQLIFP